ISIPFWPWERQFAKSAQVRVQPCIRPTESPFGCPRAIVCLRLRRYNTDLPTRLLDGNRVGIVWRQSMNHYLKRLLFITIVLAIFLIGCGEAPNNVANTPTPANQTPTATPTPTPIPTAEPLPADIVVYPGAQLVVSQRITTGTLYFYRSPAALQDV